MPYPISPCAPLLCLIGAAAASYCSLSATHADVIINEILYHAPNDLDELEYVELFNNGNENVDISDWKLSKGIAFTFPSDTQIKAREFIVVCKNKWLFKKIYGEVTPLGEFSKSLSNSSDKINLKDSDGEIVDSVEYSDRSPWPISADGYSASLERICPSADSNDTVNWAPSILSKDYSKMPSGSPGRQNSVHSESLPPVIASVDSLPSQICAPREEIAVHADVSNAESVELLYSLAEPGKVSDEQSLPMTKEGDGKFSATIPGQVNNRLVRFRVRATNRANSVRHMPSENEIRPAFSVYVTDSIETGSIPVAHFFNVGAEEFEKATEYRENSGRPRGRGGRGFGRREFTAVDRARMETERQLRTDALSNAWAALTLNEDSLPPDQRESLRGPFRDATLELNKLREALEKTNDTLAFSKAVAGKLETSSTTLRNRASAIVEESKLTLVPVLGDAGREFDRGSSMLQRFFDIESSWFDYSMNQKLEAEVIEKIRPVFIAAIERRDQLTSQSQDDRGRPDFRGMLEEIEPQRKEFHDALVAALGEKIASKLDLVTQSDARERGPSFGRRRGFGSTNRFGRESALSVPLRPQGRSALVYTDPKSQKTRVFDFVNIVPRKSGYKVRLHKDRPLDGMTTINVLYESNEETILNESLAYALYSATGNASPRSGYARVAMDGNPVGYHLWFEQPNGAFFRHNKIEDGGNLYKVSWQGNGGPSEFTPDEKQPKRRMDVVRRHEKISNTHEGYEDLIKLVEGLDQASGAPEELWEFIQQNFDVNQVANYFAVNSLISHWDGFFNNYFLYFEPEEKKWQLYPWDQDSTWSQRGGRPEELYEMPLNFGAADARPSNSSNNERSRRGFGRGGFSWWRDGGEISSPLLANPQFREVFFSRLKQLCETVFTVDVFGPKIEKLKSDLSTEVALRASIHDRNENEAMEDFDKALEAIRKHLVKRREFVLRDLSNHN